MKKFLMIFFIVLGGIFFLLILGGFFLCQKFTSSLKKPALFEKAAVLQGKGLLSKELFINNSVIGEVSDIVIKEFANPAGAILGVAGSKGAVFLNKDFSPTFSVSFTDPDPAKHIDIIDVENDGTFEFLNRGSWAMKASVIDNAGHSIWNYGDGPGVDDMDAGDYDGDGKLEYVVGFNGNGGVHLLDENGKPIWQKEDGNVWHVEWVDTNKDGTLKIVHSNAAGNLTIRSSNGEVLRKVRPDFYFSHFSLVHWPKQSSPFYILSSRDNQNWLLDFNGNLVDQFNAPHSGDLGDAFGTPVRLNPSQEEYFAVGVSYYHWKNCNLYVYHQGQLKYQEILTEPCEAIAALPLGESHQEALLLGGSGKVWIYRLSGIGER